MAKLRLRWALLFLVILAIRAVGVHGQNPGDFSVVRINSVCIIRSGSGSPEGAVTGNVCDVYLRTNGGTGTTIYIKESGTGNTGWAAPAASGTGAPTGATYITQTADGTLSAEQALALLSTGILKVTTTTGVVSSLAIPLTMANGGTDVASASDDQILVNSGSAWVPKTVPDCTDTGGNHLNYTQSTNALSCGTSGAAGSGAPSTATYITQTADGTLSAEQALGSLATGLMNSTTTTGVVSTLAPTDDNLVVGSGTAWQLKPLTDCAAASNAVTYNATTNAFGCNTISGGGTNALLDGTAHTDTLAGTVVRGDIIVGNSTPKWSRFAKCSNGSLIQYNATDPTCVNIYNTANGWGADQTRTATTGTDGWFIQSPNSNIGKGSFGWYDSTGISDRMAQFTMGSCCIDNTIELQMVNTDNGSGVNLFNAWVWNGNNGGGTVTHTPRSTAVITASANAYGYWLKPKWTEGTSGTHALIAGIRIDKPVLVDGTATTTEETTLYVAGADAGGFATNTYALHVAADSSRFDGPILQSTKVVFSNAAPTVSGFGTSPSVPNANGTYAFEINVGTGGSASTGTITLPTATTGWVVQCQDVTTPANGITKQTGGSTTTATLTNYDWAGSPVAWASADVLRCTAVGY